jgi:tight adherence protein B
MTAALAGILALALWLALAPAGPSGRRLRAVLAAASRADSGPRSSGRPARWRPRLPSRRPRAGAAPDVSMTLVVQQLAALLKGGRAPARLWEELGALYGCGPQGCTGGGTGQPVGGAGPPGGTLTSVSLEILAAARAAAMRGSPVAAAIRAAAFPEPGNAARHGAVGRERTVWTELAACFEVAEASGCPLADVLTRFAAHLEAEDDAEAARQTALAGPKATVRILTGLPFLGLGVGVLLGVDPSAVLLGTSLGMTALTAGLALTAAGRIWSARLVRAAAGRHP